MPITFLQKLYPSVRLAQAQDTLLMTVLDQRFLQRYGQ
jgi:hypothetical protein